MSLMRRFGLLRVNLRYVDHRWLELSMAQVSHIPSWESHIQYLFPQAIRRAVAVEWGCQTDGAIDRNWTASHLHRDR